MTTVAPLGVLFMAYGGPNSLDELSGYLADIRHGRPTTPAVLKEITDNYRQIGGRSPLLEITRRQVESVSASLNPPGEPARFKCYLGMRHWAPWIEETVRDMLEDGIARAVSLVLAPHYSQMSIAKYHAKIETGLEMYRGHIEFEHIVSYHTAPGYVQALAKRVRDGLSRWPESQWETVHVIFSAHSLPARILSTGDPYDSQLRETAKLVAQRAGLPEKRWSWSYQSAGRTPEPWLGPQIEDHLLDLAGRGVRDVICLPIGFVSDNVEILYDIDIQAQQVACAHGMRLERPPALNDDPLFIAALAELIRGRAAHGWLVDVTDVKRSAGSKVK
jgi:ferrochelatase